MQVLTVTYMILQIIVCNFIFYFYLPMFQPCDLCHSSSSTSTLPPPLISPFHLFIIVDINLSSCINTYTKQCSIQCNNIKGKIIVQGSICNLKYIPVTSSTVLSSKPLNASVESSPDCHSCCHTRRGETVLQNVLPKRKLVFIWQAKSKLLHTWHITTIGI